jgi:hypothetical protein
MEAKKLERQQAKAMRKAARDQEDTDRADAAAAGVDPDLVGIVAGPQPTNPEDEIDLAELMEKL